MNVLFFNRDRRNLVGGDMVLLDNIMSSSAKLGVVGNYSYDVNLDLSSYDIVHIFNMQFPWAKDMADRCIYEKKPFIYSAIFYIHLMNDRNKEFHKYYIDKSKYTIVSSEEERVEILTTGCLPDKIVVINQGVDDDIFYPQNTIGQGVVGIGQIQHLKGVHLAVEACNKLEVSYTHIGEIPRVDDPYVMNVMRGVCKHYHHLTSREVAEVLRKHKVYLCASLSDRNSLGVLEGAACGLNIVDSIYNRGNNLLPSSVVVDPENIWELAEAIEIQLDNPNRNTDKVRSWDMVAKEVVRLYDY